MMRLASVSFNHHPEQIGGAHVPAIAFRDWCSLLGVECDLVCYEGEDLNGYDGIFFATPPTWEVAKKLYRPYVVMIHAEFDSYDPMVMDFARAVVVIGEKFWGFPREIVWYPCTSPRYLLTGYEVFRENKEGLLYAARLTTWKSANVLSALTTQDRFMDEYGPVDIYGQANDKKFEYSIRCVDSRARLHSSIYDREDMIEECITKDTYWDVFGKKGHTITMKRLNLACFEAMKSGCIPIVNMDNVPDVIKPFCIDHRKLFEAQFSTQYMRCKMLEAAKTEFFGYEAVKKQVQKIIGVFQ